MFRLRPTIGVLVCLRLSWTLNGTLLSGMKSGGTVHIVVLWMASRSYLLILLRRLLTPLHLRILV